MELKLKNIILLVSTILIAQFSCKKVNGPAINTRIGAEFYPLIQGKFIEYKVDSTIYDDFAATTRFSTFYFKEVVDSTFIDGGGRTARYVVRYKKQNPTDQYEFENLYYVLELPKKIEVVDGNLRFVKLILPITYKGLWKGNDYIVSAGSQDDLNWLQGWDYQYENINKTFIGDSLSFDSTLTVLQTNALVNDTSESNNQYSEYTYSDEIYAKNVGLVKKEIIRFKRDPSISQNRKKGFKIHAQAIAHN
jgi:hypothetical protein